MRNLILSCGMLAASSAGAWADDLPEGRVNSSWDVFVSAGGGLSSSSWTSGIPLGRFFESDDEVAIEARGSAAYQFGNGLGLQLDWTMQEQDLEYPGTAVDSVDAAAHVFYRLSDTFLIGAFGQGSWSDFDYLNFYDGSTDRVFAGGEAQIYLGNFTLYAQGGYQTVEAETVPTIFGGIDIDGYFANAEIRYFATPNLKFHVRGGVRSLEGEIYANGNLTYDIRTVGGGVEYRLESVPFSIFVDAEYFEHDYGHPFVPFEIEETRVMAGLKLNFGSQTLLERDRAGATLNPVRTSPVENIVVGVANLLP